MFVPTIKYKRVNEIQDAVDSVAQLQITNDPKTKTQPDPKSPPPPKSNDKNSAITTTSFTTTAATTPTTLTTVTTNTAVETPVAEKEDKKEEEKTPAKEAAEAKEETKTSTETPAPVSSSSNGNAAPDNDAEPTIEIDPSDKERILVTLTNGKKYTADRYCPHAGADLSYLGEVAEDEYPPEIGPVLMCTLHYWEFALEKAGRSGGGWATLNACPVPADQCPAGENNKKLDW